MSDDPQNPAGPDDRGSLDDFLALPPEEQRRRILLQPYYPDVKNEIVQPDRVTVQTRYFWERWAKILGPLDTVLFLRLRQYCYYNRETGEKRDWCFPSHESLGEELGVERKAVMRGLLRLELLGLIRRERQYRFNPEARRPSRTTDKYYVLMEDPLTPEDMPKAFVKAAERMVQPGGANPFDKPISHKYQKGTYGVAPVDNQPVRSQKGTYDAVPKRDSKGYSEGVRLERSNVGNTQLRTDPRKADLALELTEELQDPGSARFYRLVVERMPENVVRAVLSETRSAYLEGRIETRPGAYFTGAIKAQARELGIELGVGD